MTKEKILRLLEENPGEYISGESIAAALSISRAAVWKSIRALKSEGLDIKSVTNRGYSLCGSAMLSEEGIKKHLKTDKITLSVYKSVDSTNTLLKKAAGEGAAEFSVIAASQQTAGRGRMGRSFYSPNQSGIYLSILLRPDFSAEKAGLITAGAAAAAANAIEAVSGRQTQIKWVNDILIEGKKVCGILTEASLDCENGRLNYAVVGIGINVCPPEGGFPGEIRDTAGSVFPSAPDSDINCRLAAALIDSVIEYYHRLESDEVYSAYAERSCVIGRDVWLIPCGGERQSAHIKALGRDFSLIALLPDGSEKRISSGEISLRMQ